MSTGEVCLFVGLGQEKSDCRDRTRRSLAITHSKTGFPIQAFGNDNKLKSEMIKSPLFYFGYSHELYWNGDKSVSEGVQFLARSELAPFSKGGKGLKMKDGGDGEEG